MSAFMDAIKPRGDFLKFKEVGTSHTIMVQGFENRQATEFGTNKPSTYPDGNPIYDQWISGQSWNETEGEHDAIIVVSSRNMRAAIGRALKAVGATEPQAGGVLTITFTGFGQGKNPANPPKEYEAEYQAPEPAGNPWGEDA